MSVGVVLFLSVSLQIATVIVALRLVKVSGGVLAWLLISAAMLTMGIRRMINLYGMLSGSPGYHPDMGYELIGLAGSAMMLAGVWYISPLFITIKEGRERMRRQFEIEELISTISARFVSLETGLDDGIHDALGRIGRFTGADRAYTFLCSDDACEVCNTHEWCAEGIDPLDASLRRIDLSRLPWFRSEFEGMRTFSIDDIEGLPDAAEPEKERFRRQGIRSLLVVPLVSDGRPVGFIGLDAIRSSRTWSTGDHSLLRVAGEIIVTATERQRAERERIRLIEELRGALAHVKTLSGLLPICASCKKIRDDKGYWSRIEEYVSEHTDTTFSHGICPDCAKRLYPGYMTGQEPPLSDTDAV